MSEALPSYFTVPVLAAHLHVNEDKVREWIASGALRAFNANPGGIRPRWKIAREDWELCRTSLSNPKPTKAPARVRLAEVIEFF